MHAEIIAVGDELSSGQRLDTNSQWLSQRLGDLGILVTRHTTIGDHLDLNVSTLQEAAARSQIVVITGGLGPTLDDLTREAMAQAFDRPLGLDSASLEHIERLFARRGRPMPERNKVQALFPSGTVVILNPHGSAPGIDLSVEYRGNAARLFAFPGVPAEMKQMWDESVQGRIESMIGSSRGSLFFRSVKLFGLGESDVEARVPTLIARDRYPMVGITVSQATITLRIAGRAQSSKEFEKLIQPTLDEIHSNLGDIIFGYDEDEVQDALLRGLVNSQQSLACVEIGGNWIQSAMQEVNGASENSLAFLGGVFLGNHDTARQWCASESTTETRNDDDYLLKLAEQARRQFSASIGLAVAGYPSQSQISSQPPGTAFQFTFAVSSVDPRLDGKLDQRSMGGHPEVLNPRAAKSAMDWLRRMLVSSS